MYQESSAPSFAQQLMKSGLPVSPTYGIKGLQNKTSFFNHQLLLKDGTPNESTSRRSHNIYQINTKPDTPQFSGHAQYFTQSNNLKKSSHLSPTYKETTFGTGLRSSGPQLSQERESNRGRKGVPVFHEVLKPPRGGPEEKHIIFSEKVSSIEREKRDSASLGSLSRSPERKTKRFPPHNKRENYQVANSVPVFLQKESIIDGHRESRNSSLVKDKEVEKDNEELLGKQKQLVFENSKLKCKISELEREIIKKNEMYTILNQSYELNTAQAKQEKENLMERIKENEQKFNRDVVNLLTEKNRLEAEKINCLEQIAEVDEKRSKLFQENLDLKEEISNQEAKIESFAKSQEHFRKAAEILKQKKQSHIAAEIELKQTLKSTLDDLALVTEKTLQIEMEHIQIVRDLENQLQNNIIEKETTIESLKKKYEQELEFKDQEMNELKKKNNRLAIEKEGLLRSLVKTKDEPTKTKLSSLEILSPKLRSKDLNLETSPKNMNLYKKKEGKENINSITRSAQFLKQSIESKQNFKQTEARLEKYREHSNTFHIDIKALQQQLNPKTKKQEEKKNNTETLSKQLQKERLETVSDEPPIKAKVFEVSLPSRRNLELRESQESKERNLVLSYDQKQVLTPKEDQNASNKTPSYKESSKNFIDFETKRKPPLHYKTGFGNETQSMKFENLWTDGDSTPNSSGLHKGTLLKTSSPNFTFSLDLKETIKK